MFEIGFKSDFESDFESNFESNFESDFEFESSQNLVVKINVPTWLPKSSKSYRIGFFVSVFLSNQAFS